MNATLLNRIRETESYNHIVIGSILRKYPVVKLNENQNGIMINISTIPEEAIREITQFIEYIDKQQVILDKIEEEADKCKQYLLETENT